MGERLRTDWLTVPHRSRFRSKDRGYTEAMAAHAAAVEAGQGGYLDPTSRLFVLTAAFLAERGYCCDSGCRHCPYVGAG